jgi:hypothetical protein
MWKISAIGVLGRQGRNLGPFSTTKSKEKGAAHRLGTARKSPKGELIILESKVAKGSKFVVRASIKEGKY